MPKGLELPLNIVVIVAVVVLVLVVVAAAFTGQFSSTSSNVARQELLARGCIALRSQYECDHNRINDVRVSDKTLADACIENGFSDSAACARQCGCEPSGGGSQLAASRESAPAQSTGRIFERIETVI